MANPDSAEQDATFDEQFQRNSVGVQTAGAQIAFNVGDVLFDDELDDTEIAPNADILHHTTPVPLGTIPSATTALVARQGLSLPDTPIVGHSVIMHDVSRTVPENGVSDAALASLPPIGKSPPIGVEARPAPLVTIAPDLPTIKTVSVSPQAETPKDPQFPSSTLEVLTVGRAQPLMTKGVTPVLDKATAPLTSEGGTGSAETPQNPQRPLAGLTTRAKIAGVIDANQNTGAVFAQLPTPIAREPATHAVVRADPLTVTDPAIVATVAPAVRTTVAMAEGATNTPAVGATVDPVVRAKVAPLVQATVAPAVRATATPTMDATISPAVGTTVDTAVPATVATAVGASNDPAAGTARAVSLPTPHIVMQSSSDGPPAFPPGPPIDIAEPATASIADSTPLPTHTAVAAQTSPSPVQVVATPAPMTSPVLDMDAPSWPDQMANDIAHAKLDPGSEMRITLMPERLGALHIRLSVENGVAQIAILTETTTAATAFSDAQPRLAEALARHGLDLGSHVSDMSSFGDGESGRSDARRDTDQGPFDPEFDPLQPDDPADTSPHPLLLDPTGLNQTARHNLTRIDRIA